MSVDIKCKHRKGEIGAGGMPLRPHCVTLGRKGGTSKYGEGMRTKRRIETARAVALAVCALAGLACGAAEAPNGEVAPDGEVAPNGEVAPTGEVTALSLIEGALDLTRGVTSYTRLAMTVHRPDWERNLELEAWTRGREDALIRFTAPPKDAGVATLKRGEQMWTYAPALRREIRLPESRMSQSWADSDFSYNDLSRTDHYLRHYDFEISATDERDGHIVYTLELTPHEDAPVVWGKEVMVMRDDYVMLSQTYYDQGLKPLKAMRTVEVGQLGGRTIPVVMRMGELEREDSWTELRYLSADFDAQVEDSMFTSFALRGER